MQAALARVHLVGGVARFEVGLAAHGLGHVHGVDGGPAGVELPERLGRRPAGGVEVVHQPDDVVLHALELADRHAELHALAGCGRPTCRTRPGSRPPCRSTGSARPGASARSSAAQPAFSRPPSRSRRRHLHAVERHLALPREEAGQARARAPRARRRRRAAGSRRRAPSPVRTATTISGSPPSRRSRRAWCRRADSDRRRRWGASVTPCGPHEVFGSVMATASTASPLGHARQERAPLRLVARLHHGEGAEHARAEERARQRARARAPRTGPPRR